MVDQDLREGCFFGGRVSGRGPPPFFLARGAIAIDNAVQWLQTGSESDAPGKEAVGKNEAEREEEIRRVRMRGAEAIGCANPGRAPEAA